MPTSQCARCRRWVDRLEATWPEGRLCKRCFQRATRIHGVCPGCQQQRLLPGLDAAQRPICTDCAGIPRDFHCSHCGEEDEPHRAGLCARCCLRDDLAGLLDDGTGRVRPELLPLYEAICAQPRPRSAMIWLRNPHVHEPLRGMARGELAIDHATFDRHPSPRTAMHLRELFIRHGAARTTGSVPAAVPAMARPQARHRLRPPAPPSAAAVRHLAPPAPPARPGHQRHSAQRPGPHRQAGITVAAQFLGFLGDRGCSPATCRQADVDAWLATGPTTRSTARTSCTGRSATSICPSSTSPTARRRSGRSSASTSGSTCSATLLDNDQQPLAYRVAAVLLLLYAQPITRIARLTAEQIMDGADGVSNPIRHRSGAGAGAVRRLGSPPPACPAQHDDGEQPGLHLAVPGYRPGQPLHHDYLMRKLRDSGIHLLGARNAALRELVLEMPPPIVAHVLG
jgi:hypothetical protein